MFRATADRDDLLRIIPIDAFDGDRLPENLGRKRTNEVFLYRTEKPDALFRFALRTGNPFFDEGRQPSLTETNAGGHRRRRGYAAYCWRNEADQPRGVSCPTRRCGWVATRSSTSRRYTAGGRSISLQLWTSE